MRIPGTGKFRNDRSLTQQQIETIVKWVDAGTPKGDDADLPPLPKFAQGWEGGEPDYVFEMPEYHVQAEGQIPNQYFWVQNPFTEDRWVEMLEVRPGNPGVVHHARVDTVTLPAHYKVIDGLLTRLDGTPVPMADQAGRNANEFNTEDSTFYLIAYVPGGALNRFRPGVGKRIPAGKWIRFNLHYQPKGTATIDKTRLGIWFSKEPVVHEAFVGDVGAEIAGSSRDSGNTDYIVDGREIVQVKTESQGSGAQRFSPFQGLPTIPALCRELENCGHHAGD